MGQLGRRVVKLERRLAPARVAGPSDPADKPPFDYAGFTSVWRELMTGEALAEAVGGEAEDGRFERADRDQHGSDDF